MAVSGIGVFVFWRTAMKKVPIHMVALVHIPRDFVVVKEKKKFLSFQDAAHDLLGRMEKGEMGKPGASAKQRCGENAISCFSPNKDVECIYGSADRVVIQRLQVLANHLDQRGQIMDLYAVPCAERAPAPKVLPSDLITAVIRWDEYKRVGNVKTLEQILCELRLIAGAPAV